MASPPAKSGPAGAHASTAAPADHGHGHAFPPFDPATFAPQLVWLVLAFAALYWLLSRMVLPRIGSVITERGDRIERDLKEAERMKGETDAALKAYEQSLANARGRAQGLAKETRDKLAAEIERDRHAADQQNAAKVADMEKRIADSKSRALASVNDIAADTASAIVERLVGGSVSMDEIRRAVAARKAG